MGSVEQWVPNAIQAATAVGQLYLGISDRRQKQAAAWGKDLEELSGLDGIELRRVVEDNPAVGELVGIAWEAAAKTASEDKRHLLAQVAAAALRGDTTPEKIDRLQFLIRPVLALDPPHITLLVMIGQEVGEHVSEGKRPLIPVKRTALAIRWPGGYKLIDPALAALEREGLVADYSEEDKTFSYRLRPFGGEFLDYLLIDAGGWPPASEKD
jgi:hypothetical protein